MTQTQKFWIGVASANHALRGDAESFMQVCHGKGGPLKRLKQGDVIIYYSPSSEMGSKLRLQAFTTIGRVRDDRVYRVEMAAGFTPFRRDVDYVHANCAAIHPLLDQLEFTRGKTNWGYAFRFGLLEISAADFALIAGAMEAPIDKLCSPAQTLV
jgi:EVE domain